MGLPSAQTGAWRVGAASAGRSARAPWPRIAFAAALAGAFLAPRVAAADDVQALFDEALALMDGPGHAYALACPKLERVVQQRSGKIGALMQLARCYEGWGKLKSAWVRYREAAADASLAHDDRETALRAKIAEVEPRVPELVVAVELANEATQGFAMKLDGDEIAGGGKVPVDPGPHEVVASAPGKKSWRGTVIAAGGSSSTVRVPVLDDARPPDARGPAPLWPRASGVLGLASLAVAIGYGIDGLTAKNTLDTLCHGNIDPCAGHTATQVDPLNAEKDRGLAMFVGFGLAGAAGVAAGIVGLVSRPKAVEPVAVVPAVGPGFGGVVVGGRF
jgi:hypothetical protein